MKNQNSEQSTVDSHLEVEGHIQSMLNGELGPQARRKLLLNIDSNHPDYWRYVALGFVEQQILSQTLASDDTVLSHEPLDQLTRKSSYSARQWALAACLTISLLAAAWWLGSQS
ncbi:MAG: hypothetical protein GXP30_09045, partial [Verrucomicrobia bacterium]|nr:hypothetical protein [Verrucomicrobiota bacterium]